MPMKAPPDPGELVADTLAEIGVNISAGAEGLGITRLGNTRPQRHNVIAGRSDITAERAIRCQTTEATRPQLQSNRASTVPSPSSSIRTWSPGLSQTVLTRLPVSTIWPAIRPRPSAAR
jgi:plasmid maintenance system antidote protein VapI